MLFLVVSALIASQSWAWNKHMENPGAFEGDMILSPEQQRNAEKGNLGYGSVTYGRWPNARVPYFIESSIGDRGRQAIAAAVEDYHRYTCLRFSQRKSENNYISFYQGPGCLSPVGMQSGFNRVSLATGCWDKGTVLHEVGHSLGLYHEQSRPDRDNYVIIHYRNVQQGLAYAFDKQQYINSLGTPYDLKSMMHYSSVAFSNNNQKTITTKDPSQQSLIDTYNRISGFSEIDIKQINLMYCGGTGTGVTLPPPTCQDNNANCAAWASRGECNKNPSYMLQNCKKSCRQC